MTRERSLGHPEVRGDRKQDDEGNPDDGDDGQPVALQALPGVTPKGAHGCRIVRIRALGGSGGTSLLGGLDAHRSLAAQAVFLLQ